MTRLIERDWPWVPSLALVLLGWASGIALWGTPEPGFGVIPGWVPPADLAIVAVPAMGVAGFVLGGRRWRRWAWALWAASSAAVAYAASFSHFGGFCLDPGEDTCVVSWVSRVSSAAVLVAAATVGYAIFRRRSQRTVA